MHICIRTFTYLHSYTEYNYYMHRLYVYTCGTYGSDFIYRVGQFCLKLNHHNYLMHFKSNVLASSLY